MPLAYTAEPARSPRRRKSSCAVLQHTAWTRRDQMGHDRQASYRQVLARGHGARLRVGVRPSALPVLPTAHSPRPRRADCLVGVVNARRQCRVVCGIWASWGGKRTDHVQPVRIMRIHSTCKCTPGLTAWCVVYRRAACQLCDQMCSPDDYLSVRSGPAFGIATRVASYGQKKIRCNSESVEAFVCA